LEVVLEKAAQFLITWAAFLLDKVIQVALRLRFVVPH
jgi:hypothetical protein